MSTLASRSTRVALHFPFSTPDAKAIELELENILNSTQFRNSKRYPAFLNYIVHTTLEGKDAEIKERCIGIDAFGRAADYDTNLDPIVRNTASEVRKRLTIYYAEQTLSATGIEISLLQGSYVPEFYRIAPEQMATAEGTDALAAAAETLHAHEEALPPQRPKWRGAIALAVLVTALVAWGSWFLLRRNADLHGFWADFFAAQREVVIVAPQAPFPPNSATTSWMRDNPDIALEDLMAIMPPAGVLLAHHIPYSIKLDLGVTLADLTNRPVILIGGPTNDWTGTLTSSLRFHMRKSAEHLFIEDMQQLTAPACVYATDPQNGSVQNDCALIARFHSTLTGNTVIVIAGTGRNGTQAAGEWITDNDLNARLDSLFPDGWRNRNLEIVLKTTVIGGKTSAPVVVNSYHW